MSRTEQVFVAIAYNKGRVDVNGSFRQGFLDGQKFYGERIDEYMAMAASIGGQAQPHP